MVSNNERRVSAQKAKETANQAAREAGTENVTEGEQKCRIIELGVFFDGTSNCRYLVGTAEFNAYNTNIDFLEDLYNGVEGIEGNTRVIRDSIYMVGIGVHWDEERQAGWTMRAGTGLGIGAEGVTARVNEALEKARGRLEDMTGSCDDIEVRLDVFGFSRGATAARDFCNRITKKGELDGAWQRPKIRFVGLFDTVGSVGIPGNSIEPFVDISTPQIEGVDNSTPSAQRIVHIVAEDEIRYNFPLTTITGHLEISMPGAHSDVGGGYWPRTYEGHIDDHMWTPVVDYVQERYVRGSNDDRITWDEDVTDTWAYGEIRGWRFDWKAEFGLSDVSFNVMHYYATNAGVPFLTSNRPITDSKLKALYSAMITGGEISEELKQQIRAQYAHFSAQDGFGEGWITHRPRPDATREIYRGL